MNEISVAYSTCLLNKVLNAKKMFNRRCRHAKACIISLQPPIPPIYSHFRFIIGVGIFMHLIIIIIIVMARVHVRWRFVLKPPTFYYIYTFFFLTDFNA